MDPARISGVVGRVKWAYFVAAAINGYSVTVSKDRRTWLLRGNVVMSDKYKLGQKGLVFEALHEKGAWRWPITDFTVAEGQITATLGPLLP